MEPSDEDGCTARPPSRCNEPAPAAGGDASPPSPLSPSSEGGRVGIQERARRKERIGARERICTPPYRNDAVLRQNPPAYERENERERDEAIRLRSDRETARKAASAACKRSLPQPPFFPLSSSNHRVTETRESLLPRRRTKMNAVSRSSVRMKEGPRAGAPALGTKRGSY